MSSKLISLLIIILLIGCTTDKRPRQAHAPVSEGGQNVTQREVRAAARIHVLDPNVLGNLNVTGTIEFRRELHDFNIKLLNELKSPSPSATQVLLQYERALLANCSSELKGCTNLRIFKTSPLSAAIAQQIAKSKQGVAEYYLLLKTAFEIKNNTYDHQLSLLYLQRAQEYAQHLNSKQQRDALLLHGRVLSTLITNFDGRANPREVAAILDQFQIWSYSRTSPGLLGSSSAALFSLAAQKYLYIDGKLNPSMVRFIAESQKADDSFSKKLERIGAKNKFLVREFEGTNLPAKDEYFYMVDRLFSGHLNLDDAAVLWDASQKDKQKLSLFLKAALQVELLTAVTSANRTMRDFFTHAKSLPQRQMLAGISEKSTSLIPLFQSLLTRAKIVQDFSGRALQMGGDQTLYREVFKLYDSLDKNIKYMATYPHMLMLAYHLSKSQFEMTFRFFYFSLTIDSALILKEMINGAYGPWFGYSSDQNPLSAIEILYSMFFAFQLDIFDDFGVDPDDFMVTVARKLTDESAKGMRLHSDFIRDSLLKDPEYHDYVRLCTLARQGRADINLELADFLERPLMGGKLSEKVRKYGGAINVRAETGFFQEGFYLGVNLTAQSFDLMRTELNPALFRLRAMRNGFQSVMQQKNLAPEQMALKLKNIDALLGHIENMKFNLVSNFMQAYRQSDCMYVLERSDNDLRNNLMMKEVEHLRQVHRAMVQVRANPARRDELNRALRNKTMVSNVAPADRFDDQEFYYNRMDFVARSLESLKSIYPHARIHIPERFPSEKLDGEAANLGTPMSATINFVADEEQFVTDALRVYYHSRVVAGNNTHYWTGWFRRNVYTMANFDYERSIASILFRIGPITRTDGKVSDTITSADLIKLVKDQASFWNQNEDDRMFWDRFGEYSLYDRESLIDLFVRRHDGQVVSPFFLSFHMLAAPYLAEGYMLPSAPIGDPNLTVTQIPWDQLGKDYARSRQFRSTFILPIDPGFDQRVDADIRGQVVKEIQAPLTFARAVFEREAADKRSAQGKIRIAPQINEAPREVEYLEQSQVLDYEARMREYHRVTGGFFKLESRPSP